MLPWHGRPSRHPLELAATQAQAEEAARAQSEFHEGKLRSRDAQLATARRERNALLAALRTEQRANAASAAAAEAPAAPATPQPRQAGGRAAPTTGADDCGERSRRGLLSAAKLDELRALTSNLMATEAV